MKKIHFFNIYLKTYFIFEKWISDPSVEDSTKAIALMAARMWERLVDYWPISDWRRVLSFLLAEVIYKKIIFFRNINSCLVVSSRKCSHLRPLQIYFESSATDWLQGLSRMVSN